LNVREDVSILRKLQNTSDQNVAWTEETSSYSTGRACNGDYTETVVLSLASKVRTKARRRGGIAYIIMCNCYFL